MSVSAGAIAKAAVTVLTDERTRKGVGWVLVAVFAPLILLIAAICSFASDGAEHNNATVQACFYDASFTELAPEEFRTYVAQMRSAFAALDSEVSYVNGNMEDGNGLDPIRVKAIFYTLCFGVDTPDSVTAENVAGCFYTTETRTRMVDVEQEDGTVTQEEEEYTAFVPVSLDSAYANLASLLGCEITADHRNSANHIYTMISGSAAIGESIGGSGGGAGGGAYLRGGDFNNDLDISNFTDPSTKNAADLAAYAIHAWESGWGYVWGTFGWVLTDSLFNSKLAQYPDGVGKYADFIQDNWIGRRTTDCVGLIKGYGWLNPDTLTIEYNTNGMPDFSANQMYYTATVSGPIDTIPEIPGLAVWTNGHIGVYIGNGEVIESNGTVYGVVKTQISERYWTHWLQIAYINYD